MIPSGSISIKRRSHSAFGAGPHSCTGLLLAKTGIRTAWQERSKRVTDVRLAEGAKLEYSAGLVGHIESLPLI